MVSQSAPSSAAHLLVVEDQADVRLMLVTVLRMEGYQVEQAANAVDGLRLLGSRHYDLVLTDYAMPGGTGTAMLRSAEQRGLLRHTPAFVLTAHPEQALDDEGGFPVVCKPIDFDVFLAQVRRTLQN
jgi:CheY-like chemotaxis protein